MKRRFLIPAAYQGICASFCVLLVISNILSAKMVELPFSSLKIPAGLALYPLTFLLSDLVTEIFGARKAKLMVYTALAMSLFSFLLIQIGLSLPTAETPVQEGMQMIFGLSCLRIFSSLLAYIASQWVDIQTYAAIKRWTGLKWLWLRNNGSASLAQIVDTVLIDLIFLWWGLGMKMEEVGPIMLFSYLYKILFSAASTPLFYLLVFWCRGNRQAKRPSLFHKFTTQGSIS